MAEAKPLVVDAREFASVQEAVDALPTEGGTILLGPRTYEVSAALNINKQDVTIIGDGPNTSIIKASSTTSAHHIVNVTKSGFRLINCKIDGNAASSGSTDCVFIDGSSSVLRAISFDNVWIVNSRRYGLHINETLILSSFHQVHCDSNKDFGLKTSQVSGAPTTLTFRSCAFSANETGGASCKDVNRLSFIDGCNFEGNKGRTAGNQGNGLEINNCELVRIVGCNFEAPDNTTPAFNFLYATLSAELLIMSNNWSGGPTANKQPKRAINLETCARTTIIGNRFEKFFGASAASMIGHTSSETGFAANNVAVDAVADGDTMNYPDGWTVSDDLNKVWAVPIYADAGKPTASSVRQGALIWVSDGSSGQQLRVSDGTNWINVA